MTRDHREEASELLTPIAVAERLGVTIGTLACWRYRKQGPPFVRISRRCVRYRATALAAWIASRPS